MFVFKKPIIAVMGKGKITMSRYIDADLALELKDKNSNWVYDLYDLEAYLEVVPTADVQEIKRAQWIYEDVDWVCSNCGNDALCKPGYSFQTPTAYCPHCGASMWDTSNVN
jgi:rubrerythrin